MKIQVKVNPINRQMALAIIKIAEDKGIGVYNITKNAWGN